MASNLPQGSNDAPNDQTPGHPSFKRQRALRACETCHARKVRCDAVSLGVPCTNCVAFCIECKILTPKRKLPQAVSTHTKDSNTYWGGTDEKPLPKTDPPSGNNDSTTRTCNSSKGTPATQITEAQDEAVFLYFMKAKFTRAPIKEASRVAYLGESSNLTLLVHDRNGKTDVFHYPLPEDIRGTRATSTELDNIEIDSLHQKGAFLLPERALCDELIDSYFTWVAPIVPVINRNKFMRQYQDPENPPSLLLLQSMLLAGSRVCTDPRLVDAKGSTSPIAMTFYKRAKALYDANYEDDHATIVQALVLMGWYWEGPKRVTKNVYYWSRVATIVAQDLGMHRSVEQSQMGKSDKRLWKRIWWTLFTRDRSVAVALGRPVHINTDDSDVEMLCEEDFLEEDDDTTPSECTPNPLHVQFFLQYVKLCEIMGLVLSHQYSVVSKARRQNAIDLTHSDMALADWLQNCPKEVYWEPSRHQFWPALLHSNYYTTLCLLHRAHMPPATSVHGETLEDAVYPSRDITFQAARMITLIAETLTAHNELRFSPAFMVYSLFSALIMHVYQIRSSIPAVVQATQERIRICMAGLKDVSRVWMVAKMVYNLFESILTNTEMEERLQEAVVKRHKETQRNWSQHQHQMNQDRREILGAKRKYNDMALDLTPLNGLAPQESYEQFRPQASAHELAQGSMTKPPPVHSPRQPNTGIFFSPSFSVPATLPGLYLVTRNSPNTSQALWETFQPDQLFPEGSREARVGQFPPTVSQEGLERGGEMAIGVGVQTQPAQLGMGGMGVGEVGTVADELGMQQMYLGAQTNLFEGASERLPDGNSPINLWSNANAMPATLNVDDWYDPPQTSHSVFS